MQNPTLAPSPGPWALPSQAVSPTPSQQNCPPIQCPSPIQQENLPKQKGHLWSHPPPSDHEDTAFPCPASSPDFQPKQGTQTTEKARPLFRLKEKDIITVDWVFLSKYTPPSSSTRRLHGVYRSAMLSNSSLETRPVSSPSLLWSGQGQTFHLQSPLPCCPLLVIWESYKDTDFLFYQLAYLWRNNFVRIFRRGIGGSVVEFSPPTRETWDWFLADALCSSLFWRRAWKPTPVFLPRESRGQRSLASYNP